MLEGSSTACRGVGATGLSGQVVVHGGAERVEHGMMRGFGVMRLLKCLGFGGAFLRRAHVGSWGEVLSSGERTCVCTDNLYVLIHACVLSLPAITQALFHCNRHAHTLATWSGTFEISI
eukprot:354306-Chlamydomonas_euryale.AAC.2